MLRTQGPAIITLQEMTASLADWKSVANGIGASKVVAAIEAARRKQECCVIKLLPFDTLLLVLSCCDKYTLVCVVSLVCKRWASASKHEMFWNVFDLQQLVARSGLPIPSRRCTHELTQLQREQFWLRQLAEGRFRTTQLSLAAASLRPRDVCKILNAVPLVSKLDLSHCRGVDDDLLDSLALTPCCCPLSIPAQEHSKLPLVREAGVESLCTLQVNFCGEFSAAHFTEFLAKIPWLTRLDVCGCESLGSHCFFEILSWLPKLQTLNCRSTAFSVLSLPKSAIKLRTIQLSSCWCVEDALLETLPRICPELQELSLSSCSGITDRGVSAFVRGLAHQQLRLLALDGCTQLTDESLQLLPTHLPTLSRVQLDRTRISCAVVAAILESLPLESLSLGGCLYVRRDLAQQANCRRLVNQRHGVLTPSTRCFLQAECRKKVLTHVKAPSCPLSATLVQY